MCHISTVFTWEVTVSTWELAIGLVSELLLPWLHVYTIVCVEHWVSEVRHSRSSYVVFAGPFTNWGMVKQVVWKLACGGKVMRLPYLAVRVDRTLESGCHQDTRPRMATNRYVWHSELLWLSSVSSDWQQLAGSQLNWE